MNEDKENPFVWEDTKKLNLEEAIKMLNECGTNINVEYEQQVLDLINGMYEELQRWEIWGKNTNKILHKEVIIHHGHSTSYGFSIENNIIKKKE